MSTPKLRVTRAAAQSDLLKRTVPEHTQALRGLQGGWKRCSIWTPMWEGFIRRGARHGATAVPEHMESNHQADTDTFVTQGLDQ